MDICTGTLKPILAWKTLKTTPQKQNYILETLKPGSEGSSLNSWPGKLTHPTGLESTENQTKRAHLSCFQQSMLAHEILGIIAWVSQTHF